MTAIGAQETAAAEISDGSFSAEKPDIQAAWSTTTVAG
jgi:hypothetical protein